MMAARTLAAADLARRRPVLVVLEGLDGVGKSTVARELAARLDAHLLATPGDALAPFREQLERYYAEAPTARALFYMSTVTRAAELALGLLADGRSVVIDRYLLSTLAYCRSAGARTAVLRVCGSLPRPDLTVYLHAPVAVRARRIEGRQICTGCDVDSLKRDEELDGAYRGLATLPLVGRVALLDASDAPAAALAGQIFDDLQAHEERR